MEGEVEIKELKKKYFISLYLVQTWHENTHHARHNEAKTFYEIAFWIFPPLFSQDLFPAFFHHYYEWKSFDRKKKISWNQGGYKELKCDFKMAMIPLCLETFFRNDI